MVMMRLRRARKAAQDCQEFPLVGDGGRGTIDLLGAPATTPQEGSQAKKVEVDHPLSAIPISHGQADRLQARPVSSLQSFAFGPYLLPLLSPGTNLPAKEQILHQEPPHSHERGGHTSGESSLC